MSPGHGLLGKKPTLIPCLYCMVEFGTTLSNGYVVSRSTPTEAACGPGTNS